MPLGDQHKFAGRQYSLDSGKWREANHRFRIEQSKKWNRSSQIARDNFAGGHWDALGGEQDSQGR